MPPSFVSPHCSHAQVQSSRRASLASRAALALAAALAALSSGPWHTSLQAAEDTDRVFKEQIRPLIGEFCLKCHSAEKQKGDLDLEAFTSMEAVRRHPKVWQSVQEQLANNEMPPKDKPALSSTQKEGLNQWLATTLETLALENAGDPGPVVLRRLSNPEYTYTIRDLTGVPALEPAREFPVDGAAGEGFMNTGQALVMSPALITKYLDAGKQIAAHAVFLPDGMRFSPSVTRRDWTEEVLAQIRGFYAQFSVAHAGDAVNLQGVAFKTNEGGRIPLQSYLGAVRDLRKAGGAMTPESLAAERHLSAKYLRLLTAELERPDASLLVAGLRARWLSDKPEDLAAAMAEIGLWQKALWKFSSVGHIGKVGGPKAWMEPLELLAPNLEVRLTITETPTDKPSAVYLVASDAGDGNANDFVVWERPRLVAKGQPDILLSDLKEAVREVHAGAAGPVVFGKRPDGSGLDAASLRVQAPSVIEVQLPPGLPKGYELVCRGALDGESGAEGSVQLQASLSRPEPAPGLLPSVPKVSDAGGAWTSNNQRVSIGLPIVVLEQSAAWRRFTQAFEDFRRLFPAALCYSQIVPVDEVVTLTLFHREDAHLGRLMLDAGQQAHLDRLWTELHYISGDALTLVDAFAQLMEYATQDGDPKPFEPLRKPIADRAAAYRKELTDTEPRQLEAVVKFAERAYRRPLAGGEAAELENLYARLRGAELPHEEAIRLILARVLVAPAFLYRTETPAPGLKQAAVNDWELASRLSYFLWSSMPDAELLGLAAAGTLHEPEVLLGQLRRMLRDARVERLAVEFACQWLHIRDFDQLDEKSERHFPAFLELRGAMYEESMRFLTDFFQQDGPVSGLLDANHTFLNEALAAHYKIPGVTGKDWRRVEGIRQFSRGGILGHATVLAKQSGASRTSPILRGNWVAEVLLGDKLPRPPKDVPRLPEEEATEALSMRALTEKHTADPRCAGCHSRIDGFGFALENFDAVGALRQADLAGHPIDARAKVADGTPVDGIEGLREYLLGKRHDAFLRQFSRKLLGYALGRGVQLSDEPLLAQMQAQLKSRGEHVGAAFEAIVSSRQFLDIRGRDMSDPE